MRAILQLYQIQTIKPLADLPFYADFCIFAPQKFADGPIAQLDRATDF